MIARPQDVYLLTSAPPKRPQDVLVVRVGALSKAGADVPGQIRVPRLQPALVKNGRGDLVALAYIDGAGTAFRTGQGSIDLAAALSGDGGRDITTERARRRRDDDELFLLLLPERAFA